MIRLLQIELIKLWYSKSSRILIIAYFILLTLLSLIAAIKINFGSFELHLAEQGIFDFPYIWHFNTYIAAYFKLFLAIIIVSMMANEYSNKTLKQNLIDGLGKWEFVLSKFITILLFSAVSTFVVFVISFILGRIYSVYDEWAIVFSELYYLGAYFIKLVGFFSMCLFFGVLTRKSAFALGFLILWNIAESIISAIVFFSGATFGELIVRFLPLNAMSNLIKEPFTRLSAINEAANQIGGELFVKDYSVQWLDVLIVLGWTAVFVYGSYFIIKRRDL
ncbi:MAG: ABC transporter permease subunit [Capnocytophaga sp.]|nr:ABC transporter permease subunit [Capnocytophaga sp.]